MLVLVLLAAAVMVVLAPMVSWLGADGDRFDRFAISAALTGIRAVSGLALVGAAVLICTTPAVDVVPGLRRAVAWIGTACAVLGAIRIGLILTDAPTVEGTDAIWDKLRLIFSFSGPGMMLAWVSAWMARRVVPFPEA